MCEFFRPIVLFNLSLSELPGTYICHMEFAEHTVIIGYPCIPTFKLCRESLDRLRKRAKVFGNFFLRDKEFDINKFDILTQNMDPICRELFEYVVIFYYQILTQQFAKHFTSLFEFEMYMNVISLNEKIIYSPIFATDDLAEIFDNHKLIADCSCNQHGQMCEQIFHEILSTVKLYKNFHSA